MSWITWRAPTKEDADLDGYVISPNKYNPGCFSVLKWDQVGEGEAFAPYPGSDPGQSKEPETKARKFKRIKNVLGSVSETAIADDGTAWYLALGKWYQYPPLPDRES